MILKILAACCGLALAFGVLPASRAQAQTAWPGTRVQPQNQRLQQPPELKMEQILQTMKLTAAQQAKAKTIFQNMYSQEMKALTPAEVARLRKQMQTTLKGRGNTFAGLNLTKEQNTKIMAISQAAQMQMEKIRTNAKLSDEQRMAQIGAERKSIQEQLTQVLTPAQQTQLKQRLASAQQGHPVSGLNLSAEQQAKMKTITQQAMAQIHAMLTPAQQRQLSQKMASNTQQGGSMR